MLAFSSFCNAYIDEMDIHEAATPQNIRPQIQRITIAMTAFSERVSETDNPKERDEFLALLAMCNGALTLFTHSALQKDQFIFLTAMNLLRNVP